ncbi:MAG: hypothetical protein KGS72_15295 [Cyanobacteria bacterium REEB67]|nr:hypothetical protein [Cyanobacteria bacterium REEB67]
MSHHETTDAPKQAPAENHNTSQALYRDSFPAAPQGDRADAAGKTSDAGVKSATAGSEQKVADSTLARGNEKADAKLGLPSLEIVDSGAAKSGKTDAPTDRAAGKAGEQPADKAGEQHADKQQELIKAAQNTLGDASASATDKLGTVRTLADAGIHNIQVTDKDGKEQNYQIQTEKAGQNTLVHMFGQDARGKTEVALRGVQHADGSFSREKDRRGHEVAYEGSHLATASSAGGHSDAASHVDHKAAPHAETAAAPADKQNAPADKASAEKAAADKAANKRAPEELGGTITSEHTAKGTGYYPANNRMEGGYKDMKGQPLHTLQDYLNGKAPYVSVAMDNKAGIPYGQKVNIPEMNDKYGQNIPFRVVDTGSAFHGKGTGRVDICTASRQHSLDPQINGKMTLQFVR